MLTVFNKNVYNAFLTKFLAKIQNDFFPGTLIKDWQLSLFPKNTITYILTQNDFMKFKVKSAIVPGIVDNRNTVQPFCMGLELSFEDSGYTEHLNEAVISDAFIKLLITEKIDTFAITPINNNITPTGEYSEFLLKETVLKLNERASYYQKQKLAIEELDLVNFTKEELRDYNMLLDVIKKDGYSGHLRQIIQSIAPNLIKEAFGLLDTKRTLSVEEINKMKTEYHHIICKGYDFDTSRLIEEVIPKLFRIIEHNK